MGCESSLDKNETFSEIVEISNIDKKIDALINLTENNENYKLEFAMGYLGEIFPDISEKNQKKVLDVLFQLARNKNWLTYRKSVNTIAGIFKNIHNSIKKETWDNLHKLSFDEDAGLRERVAFNLGHVFRFLPIDFQTEALDDLRRLSRDDQPFVRESSIRSNEISLSFASDEGKELIWNNLRMLSADPDIWVRIDAIYSMAECFSYISIQQRLEFHEVIHYIIKSDDNLINESIAYTIGRIYPLSTKGQRLKLWSKFQYLVNCDDPNVRERAAYAIGSIYIHLSIKKRLDTIDFLEILSKDENSKVRASAFYSLGRLFIMRSTQAKGWKKFEQYFKKALSYYDTSIEENNLGNPSNFCFQFYTIFHLLLIEKNHSHEEILEKIGQIKSIQGTKFKNQLIAPIEVLLSALAEANSINNDSFHDIKGNLKDINDNLNSFTALLKDAVETAPNTGKFLLLAEKQVKTEIDKLLEKNLRDIEEISTEIYLLQKPSNKNLISDIDLKDDSANYILDALGLTELTLNDKIDSKTNEEFRILRKNYTMKIFQLNILMSKSYHIKNKKVTYLDDSNLSNFKEQIESNKKIKLMEKQILELNYRIERLNMREILNQDDSECKDYEDFLLYISPEGHAVATSSEGEAKAKISTCIPDIINLSIIDIENRKTNEQMIKIFGKEIYDWIFPYAVHTHFLQTEAAARSKNGKVRIRLQIEADSIASLPLEFAYHDYRGQFLATNNNIVLSRYLYTNLPDVRVRREEGPIRMLAIIANPTDQIQLKVEEWDALIKRALAELLDNNQMELQIVKNATRKEISKALLKQKPHIIQFIGHSIYSDGKGQLALVNEETGKTWPVDDERFANFLVGSSDNLRLVCLATCESAKTDYPLSFGGIAPQLVQRGVPAVVAMQYKIYAKTAKVFLETFYEALADHRPVDWAIQWARNLVAVESGLGNREFAAPVLYMRAEDGRIL